MYLGGKTHPFEPMNSLEGAKGCQGHCSLRVSLEVTGEWAASTMTHWPDTRQKNRHVIREVGQRRSPGQLLIQS